MRSTGWPGCCRETVIRDRESLAGTPARETGLACIEAGIDAVDPERTLRECLERDGETLRIRDSEYDLGSFESVVVLGGGKAAAKMATATETVLGEWVEDGLVVTDGTSGVSDPGADDEGGPGAGERTDRVEIRAASHPIPDERGVEATRKLLELAEATGEESLALVVLSGGASALLPAPVDGVSLSELRTTTGSMLSAGLPIQAVNAVRKHCSRIKGGRLAEALTPATVHALAVSDVVGDDPATIASGPTVPDPTTYRDARNALERVGIDPPVSVAEHLAAGVGGEVPETPDPGDRTVGSGEFEVVVGNRTALAAARERAIGRGYATLVLSDRVRGESREVARTHAAVAESILAGDGPLDPPAVVLSGGETTVTVRGDGDGGPNAEFALAAATEFTDGPAVRGDRVREAVALGSVDTDGRDGPGEDDVPAGAVVDGTTVEDPVAARAALADSDSHGYLDGRNALVRTGPTGTNANDLRVVVVEDELRSR
jgi:glycerate 2-kinase